MATVSPAQIATPLPHDLLKKEFERQAKALWAAEVCQALVFDKDLEICTGCLALYKASDPAHTHPKTMGTRITELCKQQGISTEDFFVEALWSESMKLVPQFGAALMPRMSGVHSEPPRPTDSSREKKSGWSLARINVLEQEIANLRADNDKLLARNRVLEGDYHLVIDKMVTESSVMHRVRLEAALHRLLHPEGCGCPHHRRGEAQDSK